MEPEEIPYTTDDDSAPLDDDLRPEWADENREIEGRLPDLQEIEGDKADL